jgi:hypothetical protein
MSYWLISVVAAGLYMGIRAYRAELLLAASAALLISCIWAGTHPLWFAMLLVALQLCYLAGFVWLGWRRP